jgi:signal transduction histidine kinase
MKSDKEHGTHSGGAPLQGYERLIEAIQALSFARDVATVCDIVRLAARELTGADGATFVLRDHEHCYYVDEHAIAPLWKGKRFPMESCISGWVMNHGESVVLPDIYADPRIPAEAYRPTFVKSMAMVPIRTSSPIGAIGNYWASEHVASAGELRLLQALADSTSVALENIQVHAELEERVRDRTMKLQLANTELEAFSYSVSHDLRAPLATITGFAQLLQTDVSLQRIPRLHRFATRINEAAERMQTLINELLKLSQMTRGELRCEPIDLSRIARDAFDALEESSGPYSGAIEIQDDVRAVGDPALLRIVLDNLLSNARKYSSKQSTPVVRFGATTVNDQTAYFVQDNGAGFDMQSAGRLFLPFHRLHSQTEFPGTGIGLTTVQRIVQKHGGRVWAESSPGCGATFFFTLAPTIDPSAALLSDAIRH